MRRFEFVKDQASQKLWFMAPEGRPSSTPSVGIKDKHGTEIKALNTTNVTQDSVATTLSATPSVGDKQISLTSVTGLRLGAEYRLTNTTTGQYEDVRIRSLSNPVQLYEALELSYNATPTNNSFQSREFYYTLQSADVDEEEELFVATATYAVTGAVTAPLIQPFDVVLHPLRNPLTLDAIRKLHPDLARQEFDEQRGEDFQKQIDQIFEFIVMPRIRQHGKRPAMIVTSEDLFLWCLAEFRLLLERDGVSIIRGVEKETAIDKLENEVNRERELALASIEFYDADESESKDDESEDKPKPLDFVR